MAAPTVPRAWDRAPADTWDAKVDAALGVLAAGRRLVRTDHDLDPAELPPELAGANDGQVLLIRPRSTRGLRPEHLHEIEAFARQEG